MKISVVEFAELYRQIVQSPRIQGVFVKPGGVARVSVGCDKFERHMEEYHNTFVGAYDRHAQAAWLLDDLRQKGVNLDGGEPRNFRAKRETAAA